MVKMEVDRNNRMVCEPASFATTFIFIGFHLTIEVVLRACIEVRALMSDEWELGVK